MAHLQVRRLIPAPVDDVWAVVADLAHQGEWMVDVRRLEFGPGPRSGTGAVLKVTSTLFGLPVVRDVMVVTAWEPPRRMDVAHTGQFHGTGSFILDAVDNGTIVTWREDFAPPLGPIGELAFRLIVRPHLQRVFKRSLANVAARAVGGATPGA